ncbi:unnamed protein product [Ascophyllum nodosum]
MPAADDAAEDDASTPWEPLSSADYAVLTVVAFCQTVALAMCVHLLWCRKWPPYITKSVGLVVVSTCSGVLWGATLFIHYGYFRREEEDILAECDFELFLTWSTLCVHVMTFFVRIYRLWKILIKHDDKMWRAEYQIILLSSVSLIPVAAAWIMPEMVEFDEVTNSCSTTAVSDAITLALDSWAFFGICFLWFVCARQLKSVRKQFNEYKSTKHTLLYITLCLGSFVIIVIFLLADDFVLRRRVAVLYPVMTTHGLLWGPILKPFIKMISKDREYLLSHTKGFETLPSPAQLKASLAEQLSVERLRSEFRRYIKTKVAQELVDFYLESLDREEVQDFFERQAVTMRIVDRYIREGAPDQVNISGECRDNILETDVTSFDIFEDARREVLHVMETNFKRDFTETEGFRRIVDATEREQQELRLLRERGMMPSTSSSEASPASPPSLPIFPRLFTTLKTLPSLPFFAKGSASTTNVIHPRTSSSSSSSSGGVSLNGSTTVFATDVESDTQTMTIEERDCGGDQEVRPTSIASLRRGHADDSAMDVVISGNDATKDDARSRSINRRIDGADIQGSGALEQVYGAFRIHT